MFQQNGNVKKYDGCVVGWEHLPMADNPQEITDIILISRIEGDVTYIDFIDLLDSPVDENNVEEPQLLTKIKGVWQISQATLSHQWNVFCFVAEDPTSTTFQYSVHAVGINVIIPQSPAPSASVTSKYPISVQYETEKKKFMSGSAPTFLLAAANMLTEYRAVKSGDHQYALQKRNLYDNIDGENGVLLWHQWLPQHQFVAYVFYSKTCQKVLFNIRSVEEAKGLLASERGVVYHQNLTWIAKGEKDATPFFLPLPPDLSVFPVAPCEVKPHPQMPLPIACGSCLPNLNIHFALVEVQYEIASTTPQFILCQQILPEANKELTQIELTILLLGAQRYMSFALTLGDDATPIPAEDAMNHRVTFLHVRGLLCILLPHRCLHVVDIFHPAQVPVYMFTATFPTMQGLTLSRPPLVPIPAPQFFESNKELLFAVPGSGEMISVILSRDAMWEWLIGTLTGQIHAPHQHRIENAIHVLQGHLFQHDPTIVCTQTDTYYFNVLMTHFLSPKKGGSNNVSTSPCRDFLFSGDFFVQWFIHSVYGDFALKAEGTTWNFLQLAPCDANVYFEDVDDPISNDKKNKDDIGSGILETEYLNFEQGFLLPLCAAGAKNLAKLKRVSFFPPIEVHKRQPRLPPMDSVRELICSTLWDESHSCGMLLPSHDFNEVADFFSALMFNQIDLLWITVGNFQYKNFFPATPEAQHEMERARHSLEFRIHEALRNLQFPLERKLLIKFSEHGQRVHPMEDFLQYKFSGLYCDLPVAMKSGGSGGGNGGGGEASSQQISAFSSRDPVVQFIQSLEFDNERQLGRGAFGVVHCATSTARDRQQFAVKQANLTSQCQKEAFCGEIEILKKLQESPHENIVQYVESYYCEPQNLGYIVLELMSGGSIAQLIHAEGKLLEPRIIKYGVDVLKGLKYLHEVQHMIHRDIKPDNLLLSAETDVVKICDFGTTKESRELSGETLAGTFHYLSGECQPESRLVHPQYSYGSDIWAFGCSIVQMATGELPWKNMDQIQIITELHKKGGKGGGHPEIPISMSKELKALVLWCFEKDSGHRPTAAELLTQFEQLKCTVSAYPAQMSPKASFRKKI